MITRNEAMLLLSELENKGINVDKQLQEVMTRGLSKELLVFLNDHRPLDIHNFYEKLRKNYNKKKSKLYKNICREDLIDPYDILTTLSSLTLQIILFSKDLENKESFLKQARFKEITECLNAYANNYDLIPCLQILTLIKSDMKLFEETLRNPGKS